MTLRLGECGEIVGDTLIAVPLTYWWCHQLAPLVREQDRIDCITQGVDILSDLLHGLQGGPAAIVLNKETRQPVGACGWTFEGKIWSLWIDLSADQSREIMRNAKRAIVFMSLRALELGIILSNVVRIDNRLTIAWLRASKCFDFSNQVIHWEGHTYLPFMVKPMEELI